MKQSKCLINKNIKLYILVFCVISCTFSHAQQTEGGHAYDYSQISPHPRLLLTKGEEKTVKNATRQNAEFEKIHAYIIQIADELLFKEPLVYEKRGKRLLAVSRQALTRLYYLSYSYRMTKDKKYLRRAEKELNAVCGFENWNPSHFLDVGEMCMAVAVAYDWLYHDLEESTRENVRKAILEKAFIPSYNDKQAWFLKAHNNWNSVCNAGLVFGALALLEDEKEHAIAIIERALRSNQLALKAYGPDGNYPEGPTYWNYGTTFQVMLSAALESALGSDRGLCQAPGFMESAYYMLFSSGPSGRYFNYYDGGQGIAAHSSMFWFADKLEDPSLIFQERTRIKKGVYTKAENTDIERILPNALVFGRNLDLSKLREPTKKMYTGQGITPVAIVRTGWAVAEEKYLGIKGGKASDPHGHMDQGSFVYDIGNLRWAMDFGLQSYITLESKDVDLWNMSQNSQRWDIFRYNNLNHNTLTINNQRHNVDGKAEIVNTYESDKELGVMVDITPALNLYDEVKKATRKATIVDGSYLKIQDRIEVNSNPVTLRWNMVTPAVADIVDDHTIKLYQQGKTLFLRFESNIPLKLAIRPSEKPWEYINVFKNGKYESYNQQNKGTVMVGFDTEIPADSKAEFTVRFREEGTF